MSKKPRGAPRLNNVGYVEAVKAFEKLGFAVMRQKGSHIVMSKAGHLNNIVIPAHKPLAEGTLKSCIRAAGITPQKFSALL